MATCFESELANSFKGYREINVPGKTHSDRLLELEKAVPSLEKQAEMTEKATDALGLSHIEISEKVNALRLDYERAIVLLKKEVEDLKKWKDEQKRESEERARRVWAFGPNALGAVVSVLLAALVAYWIAKH